MIGIVNYGVGNLLSISNIIRRVGGDSVFIDSPDHLSSVDKIILPGVGSFAYGMKQLSDRNFIHAINHEVLVRKKIILGLCLGAQLMTEFSEEGNVNGLGWVKAKTIRFSPSTVPIVPHMGWADVNFCSDSPFCQGYSEKPRFYFVHSYHFSFSEPSQVMATTHYGYDFACGFQVGNIFGVQFHPEKSHRFGMQLFKNFIEL